MDWSAPPAYQIDRKMSANCGGNRLGKIDIEMHAELREKERRTRMLPAPSIFGWWEKKQKSKSLPTMTSVVHLRPSNLRLWELQNQWYVHRPYRYSIGWLPSVSTSSIKSVLIPFPRGLPHYVTTRWEIDIPSHQIYYYEHFIFFIWIYYSILWSGKSPIFVDAKGQPHPAPALAIRCVQFGLKLCHFRCRLNQHEIHNYHPRGSLTWRPCWLNLCLHRFWPKMTTYIYTDWITFFW